MLNVHPSIMCCHYLITERLLPSYLLAEKLVRFYQLRNQRGTCLFSLLILALINFALCVRKISLVKTIAKHWSCKCWWPLLILISSFLTSFYFVLCVYLCKKELCKGMLCKKVRVIWSVRFILNYMASYTAFGRSYLEFLKLAIIYKHLYICKSFPKELQFSSVHMWCPKAKNCLLIGAAGPTLGFYCYI